MNQLLTRLTVELGGAITGANFSLGIAALFVLAMAAFIGGLTVFLREIFLAVGSTRDSMR